MFQDKLINQCVLGVIIFCFFFVGSSQASSVQTFEKAPVIAVSDIIDVSIFSQSSYKIEGKAITDSFLATSRLSSEVGDFTARGPGMLPVRINEIVALQQLTRMTENDEAIKGARDKAMKK